jgi:hypothetical protein
VVVRAALQLFRPLPNALQSETASDDVIRDAPPIVVHAQLYPSVVMERERDLDVSGVGVFPHVGERFECGAVQRQGDRRADRTRLARRRERGPEAFVPHGIHERGNLLGDAFDACIFAQRPDRLADRRESVLRKSLRPRQSQQRTTVIGTHHSPRRFELDMNDRQVVSQRVVNLARHAVALVRGGELRDLGGKGLGPPPRLPLSVRDADVDHHEHDRGRGLRDVAQPVRPCRHP